MAGDLDGAASLHVSGITPALLAGGSVRLQR
jgi:hypothetical protein